jgi:hypothetical protein
MERLARRLLLVLVPVTLVLVGVAGWLAIKVLVLPWFQVSPTPGGEVQHATSSVRRTQQAPGSPGPASSPSPTEGVLAGTRAAVSAASPSPPVGAPAGARARILSLEVTKGKDGAGNLMHVTWGRTTERFQVGLGRDDPSFRTPMGRYRITEVSHDPYWFVPSSSRMWEELREELGGNHLVPPSRVNEWDPRFSKRNPNGLGRYWIGIEPEGRPELKFLGIHGTNDPGSLGRSEGHGCIRVGDRDLERLVQRIERDLCDPLVEVVIGGPPALGRPVALELRPEARGAARGEIHLHVDGKRVLSKPACFPGAMPAGPGWRIDRIDHHPYWHPLLYAQAIESPRKEAAEPYFYQKDELGRTGTDNTNFLGTRVILFTNGTRSFALHGTNLDSIHADDGLEQRRNSIRMNNKDLEVLVEQLTRPIYRNIQLEVHEG